MLLISFYSCLQHVSQKRKERERRRRRKRKERSCGMLKMKKLYVSFSNMAAAVSLSVCQAS